MTKPSHATLQVAKQNIGVWVVLADRGTPQP